MNDLADRYETPIDPIWLQFNNGYFANKLHTVDEYFKDPNEESPEASRLYDLVEELPSEQQDCLELYVYGKLSYRELAEYFDWYLSSGVPDGKKAWRFVDRAITTLRQALEEDDHDNPDQ